MLASISPVGEASRSQRWSVTATGYLIASLGGGASIGALAGTVGAGVVALTGVPSTAGQRWLLALLGLAAAAAVLIDRGVVRVHLPAWQRQVDERWLTTYRGWVYGVGFGFQLGAGVFTRIPTAATHVLLLLAAAAASVGRGALLGAVFGLTRALPLLTTAPLRDPQQLRDYHERLAGWTDAADHATSLVLALVAIVFLTAALLG